MLKKVFFNTSIDEIFLIMWKYIHHEEIIKWEITYKCIVEYPILRE